MEKKWPSQVNGDLFPHFDPLLIILRMLLSWPEIRKLATRTLLSHDHDEAETAPPR